MYGGTYPCAAAVGSMYVFSLRFSPVGLYASLTHIPHYASSAICISAMALVENYSNVLSSQRILSKIGRNAKHHFAASNVSQSNDLRNHTPWNDLMNGDNSNLVNKQKTLTPNQTHVIFSPRLEFDV